MILLHLIRLQQQCPFRIVKSFSSRWRSFHPSGYGRRFAQIRWDDCVGRSKIYSIRPYLYSHLPKAGALALEVQQPLQNNAQVIQTKTIIILVYNTIFSKKVQQPSLEKRWKFRSVDRAFLLILGIINNFSMDCCWHEAVSSFVVLLLVQTWPEM